MSSVWGSYRAPSGTRSAHWPREAHRLSHFSEKVDLLFYAAVAALAVCIAALVLG